MIFNKVITYWSCLFKQWINEDLLSVCETYCVEELTVRIVSYKWKSDSSSHQREAAPEKHKTDWPPISSLLHLIFDELSLFVDDDLNAEQILVAI